MFKRILSEEGAARADALLLVSVLFFAAFGFIAWTTDPVYTGIGVGDKAPNLEGQVYDGNGWVPFELIDEENSRFDQNWTEGPGNWIMVEFMDTNCGYCVKAAQNDIPNQQARWLDGARPLESGTTVEFVAVAIQLGLKDGNYEESSIIDFRDQYGHDFPYMNDLDNSNRDTWEIEGTPTYFLIAPNGLIAYSSPEQAPSLDVWEAMEDEIPRGES